MLTKKIIADLFREGLESCTKFNAHNFARAQRMAIDSIPLSDGTTAKVLFDKSQFNVLIMKKGNVVTARGIESTPRQTYDRLQSIYSHIKLRGRSDQDFNIDKAWDDMIDKIHKTTGVKPKDNNMYLFEW